MERVLLLLATLALAATPTAAAEPIEVGGVEVDLTWMTACTGPWGHEERTQVGPVTVVTYECDNGGT
jgi:hypothetical protein